MSSGKYERHRNAKKKYMFLIDELFKREIKKEECKEMLLNRGIKTDVETILQHIGSLYPVYENNKAYKILTYEDLAKQEEIENKKREALRMELIYGK